MFIKSKDIEINENNIFANDLLKRKNTIEDLSKIILSNNDAFVFSINASWGSGKTTFIKLWKAYLKKEHDLHCIYFSAWEDDFTNEPLVSILGELNSYIQNTFKKNTPVTNSFNKVVTTSGKILKRGIPAFIKGSTAGLLDLDKGYEQAISSMSEETTKALIENYSIEKNVLEEFKMSIENVLKNIDVDKPFVIFIDELDRCRPLYAIELLERIKHVFGIKNLVFVLSLDKRQLTESIKSQYGNIDTNIYLKRFIDLEYNLNNTNVDSFLESKYVQFNIQHIIQTKIAHQENVDSFHHLSIMKMLAKKLSLTLRDIEQFFIKIQILFNVMEPDKYAYKLRVFIFFEMLKCHDFNLYYDLINNKAKLSQIKDLVYIENNEQNVYRDLNIFFEIIIDSVGKSESQYLELIKGKEESLNLITDKSSYEWKKLDRIINLLKSDYDDWVEYKYNKVIDNVISKIEFIDKFNFDKVK